MANYFCILRLTQELKNPILSFFLPADTVKRSRSSRSKSSARFFFSDQHRRPRTRIATSTNTGDLDHSGKSRPPSLSTHFAISIFILCFLDFAISRLECVLISRFLAAFCVFRFRDFEISICVF